MLHRRVEDLALGSHENEVLTMARLMRFTGFGLRNSDKSGDDLDKSVRGEIKIKNNNKQQTTV
jgi:hypothetical protein